MNICTISRQSFYILVIIGLSLVLIREFIYIHPYNPGMGVLGPKWTYVSTKTFTWWFLLFSSIFLTTPLMRKQKIGFLGMTLLLLVIIRPLVQNKFPEETAYEFFKNRKQKLNEIVKHTDIKNQTIINQELTKLGFEKLVVKDSIYYFFFFDEEYPFGICYTERNRLPIDTLTFGRNLIYNEIENHWYELDE